MADSSSTASSGSKVAESIGTRRRRPRDECLALIDLGSGFEWECWLELKFGTLAQLASRSESL